MNAATSGDRANCDRTAVIAIPWRAPIAYETKPATSASPDAITYGALPG